MAPLKEAALLPGMIERARSQITVSLLSERKRKVIEELGRMNRTVLLEEAKGLILREEVRVSKLASVFAEIGVINQNTHVGALKLALLLNDDRVVKIAVKEALEKGVSIFEIRDVVCEEGFAQKMDVVYSVVSPSALPSYELIFRTKEKYFGREDVEGIKNAVALLVAKEKTTKILRNEYRKKEYVKDYSRALLRDAEKQLERIARTEDGKVYEDDFALAVYRAYFEDVCLFKNKEAAYHYLRLIERYRVRNPFLTAVVEHALKNGEKRAREKALMLIRDLGLNVDVEKFLKSENLKERVLALQTILKRGWSDVFREMLFSEYYKEREIALEAFLRYKPGIKEGEEKWVRKLARNERGRCGVLAKELLKKTSEMKAEEKKPIRVKLSISKEKITEGYTKLKEWMLHRMEIFSGIKKGAIEKVRDLAEKTGEKSAKVFERAWLYARAAKKTLFAFFKNIHDFIDGAAFNFRLKLMEKKLRLLELEYKKRKGLFEKIKTGIAGIVADVTWLEIFEYSLLSVATVFAMMRGYPVKPSLSAESGKMVVSVLEEKKKEKEMAIRLAREVAEGRLTLSDAIKMTGMDEEGKKLLTRELKKVEPPKQKPRPRVEMDEATKKIYEEAIGVIGVVKGLDSFEYQRGMLVDQYYSQNVGANKWINILIFGDNTAWAFPTADLGSQLSTREYLEVGDILMKDVKSAYVLSDNYDGSGYLLAYHDAKNGLRIVKRSFEEIKKEFERVASTEEANEFAKRKICEQLNLNSEEYNVVIKPLVFPIDYNCDRRWDDSLNCWVGNAHDFGAAREGGRRRHEGTDLYAPFGAPIYSPVDGVVIAAGWGGERAGKRVWIHGVDGYYYMMAHLDSITVKVGQFITAGTVIGTNGETGNARGLAAVGAAHNHQEVHKVGMNNPINPDLRLYDNWCVGLEKKSEMQMAVEERYLKQ